MQGRRKEPAVRPQQSGSVLGLPESEMGEQKRSARGRGFQSSGPIVPPPTLMRPPVFAGESSGKAGFAESTDVCFLLTTQLADGQPRPGEPAGPCGLAFFYAKAGQRDGHVGGIPTGGTLTRDGRATGRVLRPLEPFTCTHALIAGCSPWCLTGDRGGGRQRQR